MSMEAYILQLDNTTSRFLLIAVRSFETRWTGLCFHLLYTSFCVININQLFSVMNSYSGIEKQKKQTCSYISISVISLSTLWLVL